FEKRFREATGMTPHEALIRFRIERAAHLLATTDVNVQAVAERCGFGLGHQLAAAFRRQRGVTPTRFRKQLAERGGRSNHA
ncbi:MAG: helix-turn-helix domain-containing protein, partial [Planctomycetota bacterium]